MANRQINHVSNGGGKDVKARLHKPCRVRIQNEGSIKRFTDDMTNILKLKRAKNSDCQVLQLAQQYQNKED